MLPTVVTKDMGGMTMPMGMTIAAPDSQMLENQLALFAADAELNSVFMANQFSTFITHERCGVHLYRTAAGLTQIEDWRAKYQEFGAQTENHVEILTDLIEELGGDPMYVSPSARMTEYMNTKLMEPILLSGSVDRMTMELTCLEAVLLAERKCHANWSFLKTLTEQLPDSVSTRAISDAVERVEAEEDEHVHWAKTAWQEMVMYQITSGGLSQTPGIH